jgi:WD40 repeat protein
VPTSTLEVAATGLVAVVGCNDGTVRLLDASRIARSIPVLSGPVSFVAISEDGTRVLAASDLGTSAFLNLSATGRPRQLHTREGRIVGVVFAGPRLAHLAYADGDLVSISVEGEEISRTEERLEAGPLAGLVASGDGSGIAFVATESGTVIAVNQTTGERQLLLGHASRVWHLRTDSGRAVFTIAQDGRARRWPWPARGTLIRETHSNASLSLAVSASGKTAAMGTSDGKVRLFDGDLRIMATVTAHQEPVFKVLFSPREDAIVSLGLDGRVIVFDPKTLAVRHVFSGSSASVLHARFVDQNGTLIVGSNDGALRVLTLAGGEAPLVSPHRGSIAGLAIARDGTVVAVDRTGMIVRYARHAALGYHPVEVTDTGLSVRAAATLAASDELFVGMADGTLAQCGGGKCYTIGSLGSSVDILRPWDEENILIAGSRSGRVATFALRGSGHVVSKVDAHHDAVRDIVVLSNHGCFVSGGYDGMLRVWRKDLELSDTLRAADDRVMDLSSSADDSIVAYVTADAKIAEFAANCHSPMRQHHRIAHEATTIETSPY